MSTLVDAGQVYDLTGATVTQDDIVRAQFLIETISGAVLDSESEDYVLSASDERKCRSALVFQTAWMIEQVDVNSRMDVNSLSQDGVSVSANDGLTFVLAPLARRALSQCSWAGQKSVSTRHGRRGFDFTVDDCHEWKPLGS